MGWMFYHNPVDDVEAEIKRMCTSDSNEMSQFPVYITHHGSTWYVAIKATFKNKVRDNLRYKSDLTGSFIFACEFQTKRSNGEWGYKAIAESSGPSEAPFTSQTDKYAQPNNC